MLTVTYLLPVAFVALLWSAHRANVRRRRAGAEGFRPEGKIRWEAADVE